MCLCVLEGYYYYSNKLQKALFQARVVYAIVSCESLDLTCNLNDLERVIAEMRVKGQSKHVHI